MVLPIYTYGSEVLRLPAAEIEKDSIELQSLIDDMFDTMFGASGIGLAAPQVGRSVRLFIADLTPLSEDLAEDGEAPPAGPMVFINPRIVEESDEATSYEEGCLSIPEIREDVERRAFVRVEYLDRNFEPQVLAATGMLARVIQHESDHLDGILFVDHISAFRRNLLRRRLREMAAGNVEADYPLAD
jgi:peptide deformylase